MSLWLQNAFQLDLDDKLSWYRIMPALIPFQTTLKFAPQDIGHITEFPVYDSRRAGMYTPKQLKAFWDNIIHNTASTSNLKKITRTVLQKWTHGLCKFRRFNRRNGFKPINKLSRLSAFTGIFHKKFHRNIPFCRFFLRQNRNLFCLFCFSQISARNNSKNF